jgi:hypothetical protein
METTNGERCVDPPEGWKYGFPKVMPDEVFNGSRKDFEVWMVAQGYPQELIKQGMLRYCRYFSYHG